MAENEETKSSKALLLERLKTKYPDKELDDEDVLYSTINDDYDYYDASLKSSKENEDKLTKLYYENPEAAEFMSDLVAGDNPFVSIIRRIGKEGMTDLINSEEKQEEFAEAYKKHLDEVAENLKMKEEFESNLAESLSTLEALQQEKGYSDDQMDAAYALINKIVDEVMHGNYSKETVEIAFKALNYETDIEAARHEGEVKGLNQKIEEKLRKPQQGDGIPTLGGANNSPRQRRPMSIFDEAREARI